MFRFETQPCCTCHSVVSCCINNLGKCLTFTCQRIANMLNKTYDRSCMNPLPLSILADGHKNFLLSVYIFAGQDQVLARYKYHQLSLF